MPTPTNQPVVTAPGSTTDPGMLGDWYQQSLNGAPAANTANTTNWTVNPNQTVQSQVGSITSADGMLMQQAATKARQETSARGLGNSSLGVQAGQAALYEAALPMASQDAATYADAAKTNAGEANTNSRFNADARNTRDMGMFDAATGLFNNREQRSFTAGENAADRTWRNKDREDTQNWNTSDREDNQTWTNANREDAQGFTSAERIANQQFQMQQDSTNFTQELELMDKQNGTALAGQYRGAMGQALTDYQSAVSLIQASDMDADVKEAQIESLGTLYLSRQEFINTIFESAPDWGAEWETIAGEFLDETED